MNRLLFANELVLHAWIFSAGSSAGPSPGFSSRRGQKPEEGHILKIQYWMYAATGGPNVKWRGADFKWGSRAPLAPRWRRPWSSVRILSVFCCVRPSRNQH